MKYVSELYPRPALATSESLAWRGVRLEHHLSAAMELPAHVHEQHLLLLYQSESPMLVRQQQGSQFHQELFRPGTLGLYPGGEYGAVSWNKPADTIHLFIDNEHLETMARQSLDLAYLKLPFRFQFDDALLGQLGRQLLQAVGTQHALSLLYIESMTNTLCYHLIEHYASYERRPAHVPRLAPSVLSRIDTYLEAHADALITVEIMASLANLSAFHFARLFKQTTGMSPYQYVIGWKIRLACQRLRADEATMADISDALGFATPAHFSAAFKRVMGVTPRAFQRGRA
ncbi:MmsAB operon regulatory protein [Fibrella aestuarina BUZ 2]|uniref:MmsAB operon regulatory protein n=1 Tax=Fibrella aestuarina BUZ 2 TaxID=1166018 RepID=I0K2I9_9BACT|nr:AraC family transcriptional regulator [Fibrella aestuarina]CCG98342.1 MmsAB operon regulatory protein [Fibrella aestuarina BUZ 2]